MSGKQMLFKSAAREKLLRGASVLVDAVRVTLGAAIQVCADPKCATSPLLPAASI